MLCSQCSNVVKPFVAIDMDGTLADYHGHFLRFAAQYLGSGGGCEMGVPVYDGSVSFRQWFCHHWKVEDKVWNDIKLAYRQGAQKRSMPVLGPWAELQGFMFTLRMKLDCEIWITTTRPHLRLDGIDPDTREWLRRHDVKYDGLLYDEDKYGVLAERIDTARVVAVLDDLPEQYDAAAAAFGATVPVLRRNPYNGAVTRPITANTLAQASDIISDRVVAWREEHES